MYTTIGGSIFGTSYISGDFGRYSGSGNYSLDYGRNSVNNFKHYLSNYVRPDVVSSTNPNLGGTKQDKFDTFIQQTKENEYQRTPLNYVQQYMPFDGIGGHVNTTALLAASYEELGAEKVPVQQLNYLMQSSGLGDKLSVDALDLNRDGYVDIGEYSTSILLEDALSTNPYEISAQNINGIITKDGSNMLMAFGAKQNQQVAYQTYASLYDLYNLGEAKNKFINECGNSLQG